MSECTFCNKNQGVWFETDSCDRIRLDGNTMEFDNSGYEYAEGKVIINFCPFCGRKLKAE